MRGASNNSYSTVPVVMYFSSIALQPAYARVSARGPAMAGSIITILRICWRRTGITLETVDRPATVGLFRPFHGHFNLFKDSGLHWLIMATASASSIQPRTPHGVFVNEQFVDFKNPEMPGPCVPRSTRWPASLAGNTAGYRRRAREDRGQDPLHQPGASGTGGGRAPESRRRARGTGHGCRPPRLRILEHVSANEARFACCSAPRRSSASANSNSEAWLDLRGGQELGRSRRRRRARQSTSWSSTRARRCAWPRPPPPIQYPGERNELLYIPLGVGAVIPPWNFPFAIMAGMTAASIVTGNTVILKPSSDSPTIAAKFVEVLEEAGMPDGVVNFCPGSGSTFGNAIVEHPKTPFHRLHRLQGRWPRDSRARRQAQPGQIWIKRTILEMGGKDSILVCADADLDAAVEGVVASAFGFSGQKCSACSRAIVEAPLYDVFVERIRERVAKLTVGDPVDEPQSWARWSTRRRSPRCWATSRSARRKGSWLPAEMRPRRPEGGFYLEPTVFADIPPDASAGAGRDFRAGAGGHQGAAASSEGLARGEQHRVRSDRGHLYQPAAKGSTAPAASSTWAISTSIASARAPWWARIRSAGST